ncbi:MAG TPA: glycosyltransferase family 39 protein [Candidatus Binatia bacterium]|nr:glycosyltransferase family 39 protein [Candidatus Binatia bacterium]
MSARVDPRVFAVILVSVALCTYQLNWGLPNGNDSWAADALGPLTVLSIVRRSIAPWNSGWFYFKYPLGWPLLLALSYAPYLGVLFITGQWRHPAATYPYGFTRPEHALYVLAMLGRCVNVACIATTVALTYGIGRRVFDRTTGVLAAWIVATAYPLIYYAHTSNLDASYLMWLVMALWAACVASDSERRGPYVVLGIAAAMAVSTKEQGFAFLLPLPLMLVVRARHSASSMLPPRRRWWFAVWNPGTRAGLLAALMVMTIANNVVLNPSGFLRRIRYLSGARFADVNARLAPVEFAWFKGWAKEWQYLTQWYDMTESTFGPVLFAVVMLGVAYVAWRRRAGLWLLAPALAQYYLSLRTLDLITLRYTMPLSVVAALCGAALCADAWATRRSWFPRVAVAAVCGLSLARGVELDRLLRTDSRYQAETWMQTNIAAGSRVEFYQKPTYLPRLGRFTADWIPLDRRTIEGSQERRPDAIVLSSAAKKGITHRWNPDWRQGHTLLVVAPPAKELLQALEQEQLPYRIAARFSQHPWLLRPRITSLCPEITVLRRRS